MCVAKDRHSGEPIEFRMKICLDTSSSKYAGDEVDELHDVYANEKKKASDYFRHGVHSMIKSDSGGGQADLGAHVKECRTARVRSSHRTC